MINLPFKPYKQKWVHLLEKTMIIWAVGASLAYLVQKATVNYSFDWSCFNDLAYRQRFDPFMDDLAKLKKVRLEILPPSEPPPPERWADIQRWTRYLLTPYWTQAKSSRFIITDCHSPTDFGTLAATRGWKFVKANGTQVALFEKVKGKP